MPRLQPSQFQIVTDILLQQPFNTFFALAVTEQQVGGEVYADNSEKPKSLLVLHPYGMALLWGETQNQSFNQEVSKVLSVAPSAQLRHRWVQIYPHFWGNLVNSLPDNNNSLKVERFTRSNFQFDETVYLQWKVAQQPSNEIVIPIDATIFGEMPGAVVPKYFWKSAADFIQNGAGFTVLRNGRPASTAFAAYCHGSFLEIGIETIPECWGEGLAQISCSALIDYCLERGLTPVWSCREENVASLRLAQKLGFIPSVTLPNFRISY